jgi:hypothetical protein
VLEAQRLDPAAGEQRHRIVQLRSLAPGQADEHGGAGCSRHRQLLDRRLAGGDEGGPQHQILRRITGDEEFRKQDKIGGLRPGAGGLGLGQIGGDGAHRRIELGERYDESFGHGGGLAEGR